MNRRVLAALALAVVVPARPAWAQGSGLDDALGMTLQELEEEIARREDDIRRYAERLAQLEGQNDEVRLDLERREANARRHERGLRGRIVSLCRLSRGGYVALLLGAHTWTELLRRAELARTVVDRDVDALRAHTGELEQLRLQRRQLAEQLETQRALSDRISLYQQELEAERQRRLALENPPPLPTDESLEQALGFRL